MRSEDNRRTIDAAGSYKSRTGDEVQFNGARELANYLGASGEAHAAFVEKMFHYTVQQPIRAFGPHVPEQLQQYFVEHGFDMRQLMGEIATRAALPEMALPTADLPISESGTKE